MYLKEIIYSGRVLKKQLTQDVDKIKSKNTKCS